MTKIQKEVNKKQAGTQNYFIPFGIACVDSSKFIIDRSLFTSVNIPINRTEIDADTGESIRDFKKSSLPISYKNTTIYISYFKRILRKQSIDKVIFIITSKVAQEGYFGGIKANHVKEVLEYLKQIGRIDYTDINEVYNALEMLDTDIKIDLRFNTSEKEKVKDFYKDLKNRFQFEHNLCMLFDNKRQGLGIQAHHRDRSTIAKPFMKYYDKLSEMQKEHPEFLQSLPAGIRDELNNNFVVRCEITIKNKKHFEKFGILNKVRDIFEVTNEKWISVIKDIIATNFESKLKRTKANINRITPTEKILLLQFIDLVQKHGMTPQQIKKKYYQSSQKDKKAKHRAGILCDKIYSYICDKSADKVTEYSEMIIQYEKIFMFE